MAGCGGVGLESEAEFIAACPLDTGRCPELHAQPNAADGVGCRIFGDLKDQSITLRPDPESPFKISADAILTTRITLQSDGKSSLVARSEYLHIESPAAMKYHPAAAFRTAAGTVVLAPSATLDDLRTEAGNVVADVRLGDSGLSARAVQIPCELIAVGEAAPYEVEADEGADAWAQVDGEEERDDDVNIEAVERQALDADGEPLRTAVCLTDEIPLYANREREPVVRLQTVAERSRFKVYSATSGWVEIGWQDFNGDNALRGWAPAEMFRLVDEASAFSSDVISCSCALRERRLNIRHVRLPIGASIHAAPEGVAWAHVIQAFETSIEWNEGSSWAAVRSLPGVQIETRRPRAWVQKNIIANQL